MRRGVLLQRGVPLLAAADCATWPNGFPNRRRSWGSASAFRRFNPLWRPMFRFREHLVPHAVRPLLLTDRFRRLSHVPAYLLWLPTSNRG